MHYSYDSVKLRVIHELCQGLGISISVFSTHRFFLRILLIHKFISLRVFLSFSVYYITVKVNSSHSRLTLIHTMAHAKDRHPPWCFFIIFGGFFYSFFQISFYEIEIAAFSSIVTKPIFFFDACASLQFLNGMLH